MPFKKVDAKVNFPKLEEEILRFWSENGIFEQSVKKNPEEKAFIFYEGPPTANGKPGLHHVLARSFKDIIPRYKTMKGYRVARKAGWDTHGLPVELQVEKALGLRSKQDIENIVPGDARASVIEFNKQCKASVWEYRDLWERMTTRMGYWVDMEHPYVTYENQYIESVWWQLAQIALMKNAAGESFVYKGHKVVPYCYRCGTALSSHEVAQGYKMVKDLSVTVEFELIGEAVKTSVLAWTTTPWTLPGNVALAVNKDIDYVTIEKRDEGVGEIVRFIVAKDRLKNLFGEEGYSVVEEYKGSKLVGRAYKPLFDYYAKDETLKHRENGWKIYHADFVTTDVGTGIAHEAPAFGEDDMELARTEKLPIVHHVKLDGTFDEAVTDFASLLAKPKEDPQATDVEVIKHLAHAGHLFSKEKYEHEYPFCWRCDTPLIYFAKPSWFIRMSELSETLVANNKNVSWVPENIKEGRFGEWLSGVKDWAISRERYWGTPLPIWECEKCDARKILSSAEELNGLEDLHKPYIDDVTFACACGGTMKRTPEVMDVWFDSGAMPLAQFNYPNAVTEDDKRNIESGKYFPADYICEAVDQTRGWFYTLHAIATLLNQAGRVPVGNAFKNVICLGHVLDGEGKKMSKSKGNVIDPFEMFDQFGADQLRWFFFAINQPGLPKRFDLKGMRDVQNRVFRMLWNSYSFFTTYATIDNWEPKELEEAPKKVYDRWILSEFQELVKEVTKALDDYDVYGSTKKIEAFIDNLSNWYIRENRDRFWKNENDADKEQAYQVLYTVLRDLSRLMAPFTPFLSEEIYLNLKGKESVHLAQWPEVVAWLDNDQTSGLIEHMRMARESVSVGLKLRAVAKRNLRQPLESLVLPDWKSLDSEWVAIIQKALNVKIVTNESSVLNDTEYVTDKTPQGEVVALKIVLTPELKLEGEAREIIRAIQEGRKKAGFNVEDRIALGYTGKDTVFANAELKGLIVHEVLATSVESKALTDAEYSETVDIEGESFTLSLKRA